MYRKLKKSLCRNNDSTKQRHSARRQAGGISCYSAIDSSPPNSRHPRNSRLFRLPRHNHSLSSVPSARAAGGRTRPRTSPDCGLTALSGVNKISPLRGELFFCNFQKYNDGPKSPPPCKAYKFHLTQVREHIPLLLKKGCAKRRVVV